MPDNILCKPGGLDETEWLTMRRHATLGAEIFARRQPPVAGPYLPVHRGRNRPGPP
uniref:hypothetical protein n=1 Tax=Elstera litoralis TaxID=552518 RepID=UPI0038B72814